MPLDRKERIALIGNPNCGKTTLFNRLTGLSQKVGNFPGVTVEKRSGRVKLPSGRNIELIDLPGAYSLSPTSGDEKVVQDILLNPDNSSYPDAVVLVVDVTNLLRNLFFASQIVDLGIPVVLALNMMDVLQKNKQEIDMHALSESFGVPVLGISARSGLGIPELIQQIDSGLKASTVSFVDVHELGGETIRAMAVDFPKLSPYNAFKLLNNYRVCERPGVRIKLEKIAQEHHYDTYKTELLDINHRYGKMDHVVQRVLQSRKKLRQQVFSQVIDAKVTHPFYGLLIFLVVFFLLFQSIFMLATYPMDLIDGWMLNLSAFAANSLEEGWGTDLLVNGVIPGLSGVFVFLPQIMILFALITVLEDTGYLARVSFMSDGLLRRFGMNGRSVVPLIGGFACAIPSIMAARSIENRKERLITIFITPLMSCSARLPVYVFLVSFIVPAEFIGGVFSLQAFFMLGLYVLGVVFSLIVAYVLNRFIRSTESSSFILELPNYKLPGIKNVLSTMFHKGKTFLLEAGKIILIASVVLWGLSYVGPPSKREAVNQEYDALIMADPAGGQQLEKERNAALLEFSVLGYIGKAIEPVIQPLGFDWKIGIALINSFAAREVFVGTMAMIYSVEEDLDSRKGLKAISFSMPTAFSLLIFYVFALQCLSTVAVVRQETKSWKWPAIQVFIFTGMAYFFSMITYQILTA